MQTMNGKDLSEPLATAAQKLVGFKPAMSQLMKAMGDTGSQGQLVFNIYADGSINWTPQGALSADFFLACAQACIQLAREHGRRAQPRFDMAPANPLRS